MKELLERLEKDWSHLSKEGSPITFKANQTIFYEGHHPYGLFVILCGQVRFDTSRCPTPHPEHRYRIRQGEVVGLPHVWDDTPSCCACIAKTDCNTIFISKTTLSGHLKNHLSNLSSHF